MKNNKQKNLKKEIIEGINKILIGIDKDENEDPTNGWWETSFGSQFGESKLLELKNFINEVIK
jgi:hypothetical protein